MRLLDALDSGNWKQAAGEMKSAEPDWLQATWTRWESLRGSGKGWYGPPGVAAMTHQGVDRDLVLFPILRTNGQMVVRVDVVGGQADSIGLTPDHRLFGPYAFLAGKSRLWSDGSRWSWYISPSGGSVVGETRGPAGQLLTLELIKAAGNGSLLMWRWPQCPDGVCGQAGTLHEHVVSWREPKASGGVYGGYMDAKVWTEGNSLVTYTVDPAPYGGVQFYDQYPELAHMRPKPQRYELVRMPAPLVAELVADSGAKIAELEPLVEAQVAQAMGRQATNQQQVADAQAERERSAERVRNFNRLMGSVNEVLTEANAVATANEAQSRADMEATIAAMNAQAARDASRRDAPSRDVPNRDAARNPADAEAAVAPGQPLRFVMRISLRNQAGDTVNPTCYSNVITRDGPPGWGAPGFLPRGSAEQAHATIQGLKSAFIAQCRASGRDITSEGNFAWHSNQTPADEQQMAVARAKYREDVSVALD